MFQTFSGLNLVNFCPSSARYFISTDPIYSILIILLLIQYDFMSFVGLFMYWLYKSLIPSGIFLVLICSTAFKLFVLLHLFFIQNKPGCFLFFTFEEQPGRSFHFPLCHMAHL